MVFEADSVQSFLMQEFNRRMQLNPRYSLRAFARNLGLSPGALSEIVRQRRTLTLKNAAKMTKALGLDGAEAKQFYALLEADRHRSIGGQAKPGDTSRRKKLDEDHFRLISEWHHFAILNLLDCEGFRWDASYIAKRLGLGKMQTQIAMKLLLRLGLVKQDGRQIKSRDDFVLSPENISSSAVRGYHGQLLNKALQALELQDIQERDFSGVGIAIDPKRIQDIKRDIAEFLDQLTAKYARGKRHEVYFLETALFRLTEGATNAKSK
jgi:uncharacterized protein (TIGR02147 family)